MTTLNFNGVPIIFDRDLPEDVAIAVPAVRSWLRDPSSGWVTSFDSTAKPWPTMYAMHPRFIHMIRCAEARRRWYWWRSFLRWAARRA
jgi:hypothetical protein